MQMGGRDCTLKPFFRAVCSVPLSGKTEGSGQRAQLHCTTRGSSFETPRSWFLVCFAAVGGAVCRAVLWSGPPTCMQMALRVPTVSPLARDRARIGPKYYGNEGRKESGGGDGHCRYADMRLSWAPGRDVSTRSSAARARPGIQGGSVPSWRMARRRFRRSERLGVDKVGAAQNLQNPDNSEG